MNLCFPTLILIVFLEFKTSKSEKNSETCAYALTIANDGPVTLDVPVTVFAKLNCAEEGEDYTYKFEDDTSRTIVLHGSQNAEASFIFTDYPGTRTIQVTAYIFLRRRIKLATGFTSFQVYDYIPGALSLSNVVESSKGIHYAPTGKDLNISLNLELPERVLKTTELSYSWTFGETRYITTQPYAVHRFNNSGPQWIRAAVVARIPPNNFSDITQFKWGYFDGEIIVKEPFTNINITGNTYLQHGQLLNLDVSCSGSGPVEYCWKILPTTENYTNLSCSDPVSVLDCSFPIIYYFHDSGDFLLAIYIDNMVSSQQRNIEIHIYDVSLRPQLSTVIIPLVCTVLVLLIVVGAMVAHLRRNRTYDIETADFDFMRTEESYAVVVETSWEYMRRSFLQLLRIPSLYCTPETPLATYGTILRSS